METRGGIREMDEAGRRGRVLWRRREAGQRCNRSSYIYIKKKEGAKREKRSYGKEGDR